MNNWIVGIPATRLQAPELIIQNTMCLPVMRIGGMQV
jgi:hypothetical protein